MLIYDHAIEQYLDRVLDIRLESAGDSIKEYARQQIIQAYEDPDEIYSIKSDMPPVYIRNGAAVIVANKKKKLGNDTIYKYEQNGGEIIIPTVYDKDTFTEKYEMTEKEPNTQKGTL